MPSLNLTARLLPVLMSIGASTSFAASTAITGTVGPTDNGYTASITNMTFSNGASAFGGSGTIICIDPSTDFPKLDSSHSYNIVDMASVISAKPAAAPKAQAVINWLFDNYYSADMLSTTANFNSGYGFNQALWEMTTDFDGTAGSLSSSKGSIFYNGSNSYLSIMSALQANFASIPTSYTSTKFELQFLSDENKKYQNMVLITPSPVPEPSSYALLAVGLVAVYRFRRTRNAARA